MKNNQIIIYNAEDGQTKIEVQIKNETVWLTQKQMVELFDCSTDNISLHVKNVFNEGELAEKSVTEESSIVQVGSGGEKSLQDLDKYKLGN
jgi:hypothetical protein